MVRYSDRSDLIALILATALMLTYRIVISSDYLPFVCALKLRKLVKINRKETKNQITVE